MSSQPTRRRFLRRIGTGTAGAVGLVTGFTGSVAVHAVGHATTADGHTMVDVGFCSDMIVHHVQALAMCQRVLGRETGDPVQAAATEVLQTQAIEVGMMRAWLTDWGESTAEPEIAMAWMDMGTGMDDESNGSGMPTAMMPGLASDDRMRELGTATGLAQGRLWLELMLAHHIGGVEMARAASQIAGSEKVRRIAQVQESVQTYEIGQYEGLLATVYS